MGDENSKRPKLEWNGELSVGTVVASFSLLVAVAGLVFAQVAHERATSAADQARRAAAPSLYIYPQPVEFNSSHGNPGRYSIRIANVGTTRTESLSFSVRSPSHPNQVLKLFNKSRKSGLVVLPRESMRLAFWDEDEKGEATQVSNANWHHKDLGLALGQFGPLELVATYTSPSSDEEFEQVWVIGKDHMIVAKTHDE